MRISHVVRSLLLPFAVLFVAAPAVFPAAPAGKVLRFRANEGETAVYQHKLSGRAEMKEEGGQRGRAEVSAEATCNVEFLGQTASGDFGLRGVIQPYTVKETVDGNESVSEASEVAARYIINNQGRIKTVSWITTDPMLDEERRGVAVTPDDIFLLGGAAILPDKPVKKGDKWSGAVKIPGAVMGEDETIRYDSVLLGQESFRGIPCEKMKTKAAISFSATIDSPDGSGSLTVAGKGTGEYVWLFDAERGIIVSIDGTVRTAMTMKVVDVEQTLVSAAISGVENDKTVLTEYNGVAIGQK
jgi:hypothetical protein